MLQKIILSTLTNLFQSLFLWIFRSYALNYDDYLQQGVDVSILVLMDLPFLQPSWLPHRKKLAGCFNPCSYGSSVLTKMKNTMKQVQVYLFQSLFLWIFRSYTLTQLHNVIKTLSFNPCSYGSSVLTLMECLPTKWRLRSFNPCSYGSSVLTSYKNLIMDNDTICFNPCSYGSSVLTRLNIQILIFQWFCILFAFCFLYSIDLKSILFHVNFAFFRNLYRYIHIEISVFQCYIQTEMKKQPRQ